MSNIHDEQSKIKEVESFLSTTYEQAQAALRWRSKQSVNKYLKLKKLYTDIDSNTLSLVGSLIVSYEIYNIFQKAHRKNTNFKSENIVLIDLMRLNEFSVVKRVSKKRDTLIRKYSQILRWRELGISYQSISSKILTINGDSISSEYIRKFVTEFKGNIHE